MAVAKKPVTFYASEDVAAWVEALDAGDKSRKINEIIRDAVINPKPKAALFEIPLGFYQMSSLLKVLKELHEQRAYDAEERDPDPETRDEDDSVGEVARLISHFEKFVK
jgi:hypothetical protein